VFFWGTWQQQAVNASTSRRSPDLDDLVFGVGYSPA